MAHVGSRRARGSGGTSVAPGVGSPGRAAFRRELRVRPDRSPAFSRWPGEHRSSTVGAMAEHETQNPESRLERLMREIERYLATVDEFRRQGYEPHWRREDIRA